MKLFLALLSFSFPLMAFAATCPNGPGQDHLDIHQVMINFGKYTLTAGMDAVQGDENSANVTDAQVAKASDDLEIAISCADAVVTGYQQNADLLPDKASTLEGQARADYIDDFTYFMNDFKDLLTDYRNLYVAAQAQKPADRNWQVIHAKNQEVLDFAAHAHEKL